jgi:REP element-mobilizing transposase RayT
MARPLRVAYPGAIYHVTIRGNNRRTLFVDDKDRERFPDRLGEYGEEYGTRMYAY